MNRAPAIAARGVPPEFVDRLVASGVHPLLARVYAARGVTAPAELSSDLAQLAAPETMLNLGVMARVLGDAIAARKRLLIVADYDADGATACAVGMRALTAFGAVVDYLVPNRFEYGYGLTPEIVRLAYGRVRPDILITVDNGISSFEGVAEANRLGMMVLITDHHLPAPTLPDAACIINPNQAGCGFPSKNLAGVGVMFYLMIALRAELRDRGWFKENGQASGVRREASQSAEGPNLAELLPLVALGTVADVVPLDSNNRILVHQGLRRIRAGRAQPGIAALFQAAGRDHRRATAYDLGFVAGPRLNAAGRLTDMSLGIECLVTGDSGRALAIAAELDRLNRQRREIESDMQETALAALDGMAPDDACSLSLFDPDWHQGVVGIVAGRIKDRFHRPTVAFARGDSGEIRGSGRSIPGLHLRDALDRVAVRHPGLILRFGGHAAAAGLTLREPDFGRFRDAFEETARSLLSPGDLRRVVETDGALGLEHFNLETAALLGEEVWGQGFPAPRFCDEFEVAAQHVVGDQHLKLSLKRGALLVEGIRFQQAEAMPPRIRAVYAPLVNEYRGTQSLQLTIEHWEPAA
ncbi:MAG TPA: single-stranded-DNA-specific exonuclease RecJ [Burkholderiales bacterium]|jgi:single-stranded-DNA-specific exonuclease|nr:single-stranded-DNA-specific exonuclease RecJ [Burkholderiales bacterium]